MTGTWTDTTPGSGDGTWTLYQDINGNIGGSLSVVNICGGTTNYGSMSGSYFSNTSSYYLRATNANPSSLSCNGNTYTSYDYVTQGNLPGNGSCGLGSGVWSSYHPNSNSAPAAHGTNTVTTSYERVPDGEFSSFQAWGDDTGHPTAAKFQMRMTSQSGLVFSGRSVVEQNPTTSDANDGCWWGDAPWPKATGLADQGTWYVQMDQYNGTYGIDYIDLGNQVPYIQMFNPTVSAGGSCITHYPQQMWINSEHGSGSEIYGSTNSGNSNQIEFYVDPNTIGVRRGNEYRVRNFHF